MYKKFLNNMWFKTIQDHHIDGLGQDCSISSALAIEIPQSYSKPSIWKYEELHILIMILTKY